MPADVIIPDSYRLAVERQSGGRNTVLYDAHGQPSVMVVLPRTKLEDINPLLGSGIHPAFIRNGEALSEIFIAKYPANIVSGTAISQPHLDPANQVDFAQAVDLSYRKGPGWHLVSNAEWAFLALSARASEEPPRGNTQRGAAHDAPDEKAVFSHADAEIDANLPARTLGGSGPVAWNHDASPFGVSDLVGNVWEWTTGLRLVGGEVQIVPDNDAANGAAVVAPESGAWRAILPNGTLVAPGTEGSLKVDALKAGTTGDLGMMEIVTTIEKFDLRNAEQETYAAGPFCALDSGISGLNVSFLRALTLLPLGSDLTGLSAGIWASPYGERYALRGGCYAHGAGAGVYCLNLVHTAATAGPNIGFRFAYCA